MQLSAKFRSDRYHFQRREARANRRLSVLSSKWTHRLVFLPTSCPILTVNSGNQAARGNIIDTEIYRDDNRYLSFHEYSAFGPGEGQNVQAIRDFILNRTDQARLPTERLHAVW
jgi:hypothetical protein